MRFRDLPEPAWFFWLLRPLNNRWTWKLRLRVILACEPVQYTQMRAFYNAARNQ